MNIQPFLEASTAVQVHVAGGALAFVLGGYLLARRKGGPIHRALGKVWIATMVIISLSAFFINELRVWGPFSPLHVFAVVTPISCWWAVRMARRRNRKAHGQTVICLYLGGIVVAGGVTFVPGRLMHEVFLEGTGADSPYADWIMSPYWLPFGLALAAAALAWLWHPSPR